MIEAAESIGTREDSATESLKMYRIFCLTNPRPTLRGAGVPARDAAAGGTGRLHFRGNTGGGSVSRRRRGRPDDTGNLEGGWWNQYRH